MDIYTRRDYLFREVARLREELNKADSEATELDTLIKLGEKHNALRDQKPRPTAELIGALTTHITLAREKPATLRERVIWAAEVVLSDGQRRISRDLLPELERIGVTLTGKDPVSNLSAYLSREKDIFSSDLKAGGWTLLKLQKKTKPDDVATPTRASGSASH